MAQNKHIVIAGASGLIGTHLVRRLAERGDLVIRLSRPASTGTSNLEHYSQVEDMVWDPSAGQLDQHIVDNADAVINLAGASIGGKRWNRQYKRDILKSRIDATTTLTRAIRNSSTPPEAFLSASATGYYGFPNYTVDESSDPGDTFLSSVCERWEMAAHPAMTVGTRLAYLRTGLVMSPEGGALEKLLLPLKLGVGGPLGSGSQLWSWITLEDHVRAMLHILDDERAWGPVNLVSPGAATNQEVTAALAHAYHRPSFFKVPAPALRLVVGEFSSEIVSGVRVEPTILKALDFKFLHTDVSQMAQWVVSQDG